jgi:hypothetical protein
MLSIERADVFVEVAVGGSVDVVDTLVGSRENVGSGLLPGTGVDVVPVPGILPHALTSININKIKYGNRFSVIPPWFKVFSVNLSYHQQGRLKKIHSYLTIFPVKYNRQMS